MGAANECVPYYEPGNAISAQADSAITGKRFVDIADDMTSNPNALSGSADGGNIVVAHATAGGQALGVSSYDAPAAGDALYVLCGQGFVVPVTADGALSAGQMVEVGTAGKAVVQGTGRAVGRALADAADGDDAVIFLFGVATPAE